MWRKQEEPKANTSPEVQEQPRVEQSAPAVVAPVTPASPAPVREVATPPVGHLTSTLVIKGEITGRDDLFIDGEVQGKIRLEEGRLTVGPNGRVTADVEAREIVIRGRVKGNLSGRERVEISHTGCATGDVTTKRILIEDGAEMHGRVEIKGADVRQPPQSEQAQEKKKSNPVASAPAPIAAVPIASSPTSAAPAAGKAGQGSAIPASAAVPNKNGAESVATNARESAPVS